MELTLIHHYTITPWLFGEISEFGINFDTN